MTKRVLITVQVEQHHAVRVAAASRRVTVSALYQEAARRFLDDLPHAENGTAPLGSEVAK